MIAKVLFVTFLCLFGNISANDDFDYKTLIQDVVVSIEEDLSSLGNETLRKFYPTQVDMVRFQFERLAEIVGNTNDNNPFAIAHVHKFRQNYSSVSYLLEKMIGDTRDSIIETFDFQKRHLSGKMGMVDKTSNDIYFLLVNKNCNKTVEEKFYSDLYYGISSRMIKSIKAGHEAYMSQLEKQDTPFEIFQHYVSELIACSRIEPMFDTTACMVKKDDLYMSAAINLIRETLKSFQDVVENFNLKVMDYILRDIDESFDTAYKAAVLIRC